MHFLWWWSVFYNQEYIHFLRSKIQDRPWLPYICITEMQLLSMSYGRTITELRVKSNTLLFNRAKDARSRKSREVGLACIHLPSS
jgi:hypothetical protein